VRLDDEGLRRVLRGAVGGRVAVVALAVEVDAAGGPAQRRRDGKAVDRYGRASGGLEARFLSWFLCGRFCGRFSRGRFFCGSLFTLFIVPKPKDCEARIIL
jgi:hypothetical protein